MPTLPLTPATAVQDGSGLLPAYRGTLHALRSILREEGWRALYSGAERGCCAGVRCGGAVRRFVWCSAAAALLQCCFAVSSAHSCIL